MGNAQRPRERNKEKRKKLRQQQQQRQQRAFDSPFPIDVRESAPAHEAKEHDHDAITRALAHQNVIFFLFAEFGERMSEFGNG